MKIIFILLFFLNFISFSQQITIEGIVIDSETNKPLINANVYLLAEAGIGTTTDEYGIFKLEETFDDTDIFIISYIGYETQRIHIAELVNIPSVPTSDGGTMYTFALDRKIIPTQTVLVEASVGKK
jgi:hypothetical protein